MSIMTTIRYGCTASDKQYYNRDFFDCQYNLYLSCLCIKLITRPGDELKEWNLTSEKSQGRSNFLWNVIADRFKATACKPKEIT